MKRSFFQAAVVSILLYGCTTWTLTKRLEKKLDGNYTRMLRAVLNKSWRQHPTRHQLYGHLPPITKAIQVRRTRHAGHCWRSKDELISDVLLWTPTYGRAKAGRPARTYIQQLCEDTGCNSEDLPEAMSDREKWRERVRDIRAGGTTWWWWWYGSSYFFIFCNNHLLLRCYVVSSYWKTITDADYADDIALLANTPNQTETLLHSLERYAAGIGLHVNAHKTEYICYNQTGDITTLDGTSLKLVDKFTYLGSSVSSTEKDIDTRLTKAWTAIDRLSIIWKSEMSDKMKRSFFQAAVVSILLYGCTT